MNPRQDQIDRCRTQAIQLMQSPRGLEAASGGYYLELFGWLFRELEQGRTPTGIPVKLMEGWRVRVK